MLYCEQIVVKFAPVKSLKIEERYSDIFVIIIIIIVIVIIVDWWQQFHILCRIIKQFLCKFRSCWRKLSINYITIRSSLNQNRQFIRNRRIVVRWYLLRIHNIFTMIKRHILFRINIDNKHKIILNKQKIITTQPKNKRFEYSCITSTKWYFLYSISVNIDKIYVWTFWKTLWKYCDVIDHCHFILTNFIDIVDCFSLFYLYCVDVVSIV